MNHLHRIGLGIVLLCAFGCLSDAAKPYGASGKNLKTWLSSMRSKRQNMESDKIWSIRDAIPGEPELDYPIYSEIPDTDFSCDGRVEGYYADVGARCQVFRICANTANDTAKGFAFLCPNGTLFNQEFFVCDWYMNVKCDSSENFYNLNDQIGKTMNTYSKQELMGTARDMIMYPKQTNNYNGDLLNSYPNQMKQQVGLPSRGSSNLGPTTPNKFSPYENGNNEVQRGSGEPVYVNSLGQLSTDRDSGFDPKNSFILKPDKDSDDTLKGIGNSYQFGFNDQTEAPTRGSEDLSEPVEPSAHADQYLPPYGDRHNPKQIYTYPLEAQQQNANNIQGILPEYTGSSNSQLPSQNPKYQTQQQVYDQPQQVYGQPQQQHHQQQQAQQQYQQPKQIYAQPQQPKQIYAQPQQPKQVYAQPQQPKQVYAQQPKQVYAQPQQQKQGYAQPSQAKPPVQLYQQPKAQQAPKPQYQNQPQQSNNRQQPQAFQQHQNQQPSSFERRQFNVQPQGHGNGNTNQQHHHQQSNINGRQQTPNQNNQHNQHNQHNNHNSNDNARLGNRIGSQSNNQNNGNKQSNGEYVRSLLGGVQELHHDKGKLVELIQRLFVPPTTNTRVVSADVHPSQAQESYSFTFDGSGSAGAPSNTRSAYQSPAHTHNQNCGHSQRW